jgi:hypothetical protein
MHHIPRYQVNPSVVEMMLTVAELTRERILNENSFMY